MKQQLSIGQRILNYARHVWFWLTEPAAGIQEPERRHQAQLLSALYIPTIMVCLIGSLFDEAPRVTLWITAVVLLIAYGLSQGNHAPQHKRRVQHHCPDDRVCPEQTSIAINKPANSNT